MVIFGVSTTMTFVNSREASFRSPYNIYSDNIIEQTVGN